MCRNIKKLKDVSVKTNNRGNNPVYDYEDLMGSLQKKSIVSRLLSRFFCTICSILISYWQNFLIMKIQ